MIWILLYILPFFISIILGYKKSKKAGLTRKEYLKDVALMFIPVLNICVAVFIIVELLLQSKIAKDIEKHLNKQL